MSYIKFENIVKKYGDNTVLRDVSLTVELGELVTLLGPSGCGKSTLLRCLAGLEQVRGGRIYVDGRDVTYADPKDRQIGMVFQQYSLFPNMNVFENIAFGLRMKKMHIEDIRGKVAKAVAMVALEGKENAMPAQLSGGQQQRVALARSIVTEPKVLLLDEPLSAIDAKLRKSLQKEIRRIQRDMGITTIFVTHDQDEAMVMSDVIHLFNAGRVEQSGSPIEMYTQPETSFAASFIANYNILSSAEFASMTGRLYAESHEVAIRPETVELSSEFAPVDGAYQFQGKIIDQTPRGNVLRYKIEVGGMEIVSDTLFCSRALFAKGDRVHITIMNRNCIRL
ncbi:MAG: ABC transporter ATP-binding protein [Synergistaceae bacterium]|nr:ABC transporter ATP-binding protein [Synergistaceae bacterium]